MDIIIFPDQYPVSCIQYLAKMIRILKFTFLILVSVILQNSIIANISIFGSKSSLPLVLTVSVALLKGSFQGEIVGFFSGFLCDLSSGGPFIGIQSFNLTLIGFSVGLMRSRFYSESIVTQSIASFSATLFEKLISLLILNALLTGFSSPKVRILGLIFTAFINSLLTIIIFRVLAKTLKEPTN